MTTAAEQRRIIEALANIVQGLDPWIYMLTTIEEEVSDKYVEEAHDQVLTLARSRLLWHLAKVGALDRAVCYNECGEPGATITRLDPFGGNSMRPDGSNLCRAAERVRPQRGDRSVRRAARHQSLWPPRDRRAGFLVVEAHRTEGRLG